MSEAFIAKPAVKQDQEPILDEPTRSLYELIPLSILLTLINAAILAYIEMRAVSLATAVTWFSVMVLILAWRGWMGWRFQHPGRKQYSLATWKMYFRVGVVLTGLTWSASSIVMFPHNHFVYQVFLAFIVAGMSAGAIIALAYDRFSCYAYISLLLVPLILQFFMQRTELGTAMGIMSSLFFVMLIVSSNRIYQNIMQNIQLRMEAVKRESALAESEEKHRLMFDYAPIGILQFSSNGIMSSCNPLFARILGVEKQRLLGLNLHDILAKSELNVAFEKSLVGGVGYYEGVSGDVIGHGKTPIMIVFGGMRSPDKELNGGVAILEDISQRKHMEQMKDDFIATVSHELRTPLTSIHGALEIIVNSRGQDISQESRHLLDIANRNSQRLIHIVNDILDMSSIEAGKMQFKLEVIDLDEFIKQAIEANQVYAKQFGVALRYEPCELSICANADHFRLMQVMSNLISNAVKFSPRDNYVDIRLFMREQQACIDIVDHGRGIATEFQDKIFQKFSQYDSSDSRKFGGTGLGLSIAKAIVEMHAGSIEFSSRQAVGTTFTVCLPAATCSAGVRAG
ncbi:MAG: ATP-binding protein [Thiohalophilus sp.]|jgi:PAS domain S-box-containing protein